jgi:uncharacterized membrane protein (DUF373 family)
MLNAAETPRWNPWVEKFEKLVVAAITMLLVLIVSTILVVVAYLFVTKVGATVTNVDELADIQQSALRAFSGILLVLLGLELLDTVKVYFWEHRVRGEVILLVSLIAMGRAVLEIDLHHIEPFQMIALSALILALSIGYFLVRRATARSNDDQPAEGGGH